MSKMPELSRVRATLTAALLAFAIVLTGGALASPALAYNGTLHNTCAGKGGSIIGIQNSNGQATEVKCGYVLGGITALVTTGPTRIQKINQSGSVCYNSGLRYNLVTTTNAWNVASC